MGSRAENGQEVDVRNCFAVPLSETAEGMVLDMPFSEAVAKLMANTGSKEQLVGWCVFIADRSFSASEITRGDMLPQTDPQVRNPSSTRRQLRHPPEPLQPRNLAFSSYSPHSRR